MRIGIFLPDSGPLRAGLIQLGHALRLYDHVVNFSNFHLFRRNEKDRFDGVLLPRVSGDMDMVIADTIADAYASDETLAFVVDCEDGLFSIGDESPRVPLPQIRELAAFLLD